MDAQNGAVSTIPKGKPMKRILAVIALAVGLSACAITGQVFGPSPEAQIQTGAQTLTAVTTIATALLKNDRITVEQAKNYRGILGTASTHLDAAAATLKRCRQATGSSASTRPDPCAPGIMADIGLAISIVGELRKTLDAKH
jgi:hypothetical protein